MINKNTQIEAYVGTRALKQHEEDILALIADHVGDKPLQVLDIGCADALFCAALNRRFPAAKIHGFDLSEVLIARARSRNIPNSYFQVGNALTYQPDGNFDLIVASGILSVFEDFEPALTRWLECLTDSGVMFVFGRFNSADIDTRISTRNNYNNSDWEGGLTAYSVHSIDKFLEKKGFRREFHPFNLKIDIARSENPITTYTVDTVDGRKLVVNGANLLAEHFFLKIWK